MVAGFRPQGGGIFAAEQLRWLRQRQAEAQRGSLGQEQLPSTGSGGFTLAQPVGQALRAPLAGGSWQRPVDTGTWASMGDGERLGGTGDIYYAKQEQQAPVPQLVNPKTGGAGGTPSATGWKDTSVPDLTLRSDNAANKPQGPGATGVFANDQWVNEAGSRYEYGDATQAGGKARAGTALAKGAIKTWVDYDGSRDTQLHERGETSWRRVNRWTQEGVAEHGLTPQDAHNAALARLKRDFELSKLDWRTSGYDLSNVQSAAPGMDWGKASAVGTTPATTPGTAPGTTPTTTTVPGQTGPVDGSGLTEPVRLRMLNEADAAFRYMLQEKGFDPDSGGFATSYLRKYYMPDIQGLQQMAGYNGSGEGIGANEIAGLLSGLGDAMMAKGGSTANYVRGVADRAVGNAGGYLDNASDDAAMAFLENANYLRNRGSALAENAAAQRFQRWQGQYSDDVNRTLGGDTSAPQTFREFMRRRGYTVAQPFR